MPMTFAHRWRIFYLVVFELSHKYTKALAGGFFAGLLLSLTFWKMYPFVIEHWFVPVDRVGIVGEFTPNSLPISIQKEISIGLTKLAPDGSVLPGLATTWVATDSGKTFTFYLKTDVLWHTGKSVTAQDVNYNIKNVTFTVVNPKTIKVNLPTPYSPLPSLLSKPLFQSGLVGFGDYKVVGIKLNGTKVTYLKIVPASKTDTTLKAKEYRFYRTDSTAVKAYKLGEIDRINDLSEPYDLKSWGTTKVDSQTRYDRIVSLFFNVTLDRFKDKNVRHGLAYAIPEFSSERALSPISKTSWAYTDKVKKYTFDLPGAKKILSSSDLATESGAIELTTFSAYADIAQSIADSWSSLGIATEVKVVNSLPETYQVVLIGQDLPPDPDQYPFWHSTQKNTNITNFGNIKIDKLLEDARQVSDNNERKKIYADFQRRIIEEAPAIFLYYPTVYTVSRRK